MYEATSPYFVGYVMHYSHWDKIQAKQWSEINTCPSVRHKQKFCRPMYGKFSDLVFIHNNHHKYQNLTMYENVMGDLPDDLYWTPRTGFPKPCIKREEFDPVEVKSNEVPAGVAEYNVSAVTVDYLEKWFAKQRAKQEKKMLEEQAKRNNTQNASL